MMPDGAAWLLPLAFVLDLLLGDPRVSCHPVCLAGSWCRLMERFWKRLLGKSFFAGAIAWSCSMLPWLVMAAGLLGACRSLLSSPFAGLMASAGIVYCCMAPRSLAEHAWRVIRTSGSGDVAGARLAVAMIVGRDTGSLDMHGVLRAAIESVAENLTDGVLATIFWATLGCLAGGPETGALCALFHRVSNIMDAMWGKKNDEYRHFGTWTARADDVLNWFPARLSLLLIAFAAFLLPGCSSGSALRIGWKYRYEHASPNSAWSEAAFAGALGLRLSGPVSYKGLPVPYPYIGEGRLDATIADAQKSVVLMTATTILSVALSSLVLAF